MANIKLVPTRMSDIGNIMSWVNDPEVTAYFAWNKQITLEEERAVLTDLLASKNDYLFTIMINGKYAGQCSINKIYWPAKNGRIFMVLKKEFQGKRHAKQILELLKEKAFDELNLHKLWLIVREDNFKGLHIYSRCGFKLEGYLHDEYFVNGNYLDMLRMAILNT